ncbi:hypothetical protein ACMFMG_008596 [Clarireedia jacksonii]
MVTEERVPTINAIVNRPHDIESHLEQDKCAAFQTFKQRCLEDGLLDTPSGLGKNDVSDGITDDCTLLRFLRARQYNPEEALKQFSLARATQNADQILSAYDNILIEDFERCRQLYPSWTGRRDKNGLPVYCFDVSSLDAKFLAAYKNTQLSKKSDSVIPGASRSDLMPVLVYHENKTRFVLPLCSAVRQKTDGGFPVTNCLYLVDISGLSLKQAWDIREYVQDTSGILANNYPEVIDKVFVIGAPFYFSKIWAFIKGWIEPNTASKLVFLSEKEVLPTLSDRIDMENVPKMFGGKLDFKPGMLPDLDIEIKKSLSWTTALEELPPGPVKWTLNEVGKAVGVAVGSVKEGTRRWESLAALELGS